MRVFAQFGQTRARPVIFEALVAKAEGEACYQKRQFYDAVTHWSRALALYPLHGSNLAVLLTNRASAYLELVGAHLKDKR
jgi:hypothetical protein